MVGGLVVCRPPAAKAEPFTPADDREVLERLPLSPLEPGARRLQVLRSELAQQPDNLRLATRLAWDYIEQGRALSDPRFYGYAQGTLAPWWNAADPPVPVLVLRATIRQHDHDFTAALSDLGRVLQVDPSNAQAWLTRAVVLQVRGEYAEARRSCLEVLQRARPLVAATCLSSVESLNGAATKGYDMLRRALAQPNESAAEVRRWALTTLAEIAARRGDARIADQHFQQALSLGRADDYLLGSYADFLLDHDRAADVHHLLQRETRADALLLRLALAERRLASTDLPQHLQALQDRFTDARARGDTVHRREEARFALRLLDQPDAALQLARENWAVQREPWDARLLLEAALATGDHDAARPVLDFLAATGTEDVVLARLSAQVQAAGS